MRIVDGGETAFTSRLSDGADRYGQAVLEFAKRWAESIEPQLKHGRSLSDVADAAADEADTEGITETMFANAVEELTRYWAYGQDLKKWYDTQYLPAQQVDFIADSDT